MHVKISIIQTRVNYHAFECSCVIFLWSEPLCSGVCVLRISDVFSWFLLVGLAHAFVSSRAVLFDRHFSDRKSPPFLYEVAIENARSKNAARKSPKSDRIRCFFFLIEKSRSKNAVFRFRSAFSVEHKIGP